jgi:hypothetical protein
MENYNIESILRRVTPETQQKTASEEGGEPTPEKNAVDEARNAVSEAVNEATKEAAEPPRQGATTEENTNTTQAVEKMATELLDADTDTMLKLAYTMGSAFEEGRLASAAAHVHAAQSLEQEENMPKTAEEAQQLGYVHGTQALGAVIDAADAGYTETIAGVEKLAAAIHDRGYNQTKLLVKKAQEANQASQQ